MSKSVSLLTAIAFVAMTLFAVSCAKKYGDEKGQILCPVMEGKIDKKLFGDYKGKRIYFCCSGCKEQFMKDPEKYMKKLEGVKLDDSHMMKDEHMMNGDRMKNGEHMMKKGDEEHMNHKGHMQ